MTNRIFCIGLTRTEQQVLGALLPVTFPILPVAPDALDNAAIEQMASEARCMILNPKRLSVDQLANFLYFQDSCRVCRRPVPIILFSDTMTREQNRAIPMPEFPILVVDLHKRIDRNRKLAVKLLRESGLPCGQNRMALVYNLYKYGFILVYIYTTGLDPWKDRIIAIRIARMANFEINWERPTIYIRQPDPLLEPIADITGITDEMLSHGVSLEDALAELDELPCKDTPFLFTDEEFMTGFLNAAYLRCGKTFDRPYIAIDKLANIPFGYLMQRKARNIPSLTDPECAEHLLFEEPLQELYALSSCTFGALQTRYDVPCPGAFEKLYAAELCER